MRPRPGPHADAVSRRLELLSLELNAAAPSNQQPDEPPDDQPDLHTHIRLLAPLPQADEPGEPDEPDRPDQPRVAVIRAPGRHAARRQGPPVITSLLPDAWRGRVALGPGPIAVVAVLVALGLALTTWWALRGQAEPVPSPGSPRALTTPVLVGAASASASDPGELVVDVAGKVRRPGIAVLKPGDRVVDALRAAGGVRKGVDLSGLNLARALVDGEQVVVGIPPPPGIAASAAGDPAAQAGGLVNINTATSAQLEELPGVGPVTAESIIAFRTEHGAFSSVEELLDVSGIGDAILPFLHVGCQAL
jgi:competence protein ComEA